MNWYLKVLKNYVGFSGRARRKEYWMFILFHMLVTFAFVAIEEGTGLFKISEDTGVLSTLYGFAIFLPWLAAAVRRLHDRNRSGWWLLIGAIPVLGAIVLLVWLVTEGDRGDNRFGSDPKSGGLGGGAVALA